MARSHIAFALAASLLAALIVSQLVATLGFPHVDHKAYQHTNLRREQVEDAAADASQYLVGVGKADITGYVSVEDTLE